MAVRRGPGVLCFSHKPLRKRGRGIRRGTNHHKALLNFFGLCISTDLIKSFQKSASRLHNQRKAPCHKASLLLFIQVLFQLVVRMRVNLCLIFRAALKTQLAFIHGWFYWRFHLISLDVVLFAKEIPC